MPVHISKPGEPMPDGPAVSRCKTTLPLCKTFQSTSFRDNAVDDSRKASDHRRNESFKRPSLAPGIHQPIFFRVSSRSPIRALTMPMPAMVLHLQTTPLGPCPPPHSRFVPSLSLLHGNNCIAKIYNLCASARI